MFSGISPDFAKTLKEELFGCFKYIHIPYSELMNMPTKDRKYYIRKHNEVTNMEKENDHGSSLTQEQMQDMGLI